MQYNLMLILPLILACCILATVGFTLLLRRNDSVCHVFVLLIAALLVWTVGYAIELSVLDLEQKIVWANIQFLGIAFVPFLWLNMVCRITHRIPPPRWSQILLLSTAIIVNLAAWTNPLHGTFRESPQINKTLLGHPLLNADYGFVHDWVFIPILYMVFIASMVLLIRAFRRTAEPLRKQFLLLGISAALPMVAGVFYLLDVSPFRDWNPSVMLLTVSGLIIAMAHHRFRLFDLIPIARTRVLECMPTGVIVTDTANRLLDYNPAACRYLSQLRTCRIGDNLAECFRDLPGLAECFLPTTRSHPPPRSFPIETEQGPRFLEVSLVDIQHRDHSIIGRILLVNDVSERRRQEEQQRDMDRRRYEVQRLESLGVLAGGIAHDFNNLLMIISGNTELAQMDLADNAESARYLREIQTATRTAAEVCEQILAYTGKNRYQFRNIDLSELMDGFSQTLRLSIPRRISVDIAFEPNLPHVTADSSQIRQALLGLALNGMEAIDSKSGSIRIAAKQASCSDDDLRAMTLPNDCRAGSYLRIDILDDGCGMSPDTIHRVFDPFFTTKTLGRGLGLSAVMGIVRAHHGALDLESKPGEGTMVSIYLPVQSQVKTMRPSDRPLDALKARHPVRILVVDDEAPVLELTRHLLERAGHTLFTRENGKQSIEFLRDNPEAVDLVIMDLSMPGMDGMEAFRALRRIRPDLRVMLASGYSEPMMRRRYINEGLAAFVQKPWTYEALVHQIDAIVESTPESPPP